MAFIHNLSTTNATTTSLPFRLYSATSTSEKIINAVIYYVLVLIPGMFTAYVISHRKRNFVDVIMNFKCGYYAGLSSWVSYDHWGPYQREAGDQNNRITVRPNKPKCWSLEQVKVNCRAMKGDGWLVP